MELHPAIVHFPIALIAIATLFAVLSLFTKKDLFREVAFWNLLIGVIAAIGAVFTGLIEEQNLVHNDEVHQVLTKHKFNGVGILILSFALLTWVWVRKNKFKKSEYIGWVLSLVLVTAAVFYQGFLGGKMVFQQGAGVKPMEQHMGRGSDSTGSHSRSNPADSQSKSNQIHQHGSTSKPPSPSQTVPANKQHDHSTMKQDNVNKQDTLKKPDSIEIKKKKQLKDMKY